MFVSSFVRLAPTHVPLDFLHWCALSRHTRTHMRVHTYAGKDLEVAPEVREGERTSCCCCFLVFTGTFRDIREGGKGSGGGAVEEGGGAREDSWQAKSVSK